MIEKHLPKSAEFYLPVTAQEAKLLHSSGWSSGYGWEKELDWWVRNDHGKPAYSNSATLNKFKKDLSQARRVLLEVHYRTLIQPLVKLMVEKLTYNHFKGGWDDLDPMRAFKLLVDESSELIESMLDDQETIEVGKEAADVANFALIAWQSYINKKNKDDKNVF